MTSETETSLLGSQLWHACAGGMVQMPPVDSRVFYFPQGHAEHAFPAKVDFDNLPPTLRVPPLMLCRIDKVLFMADPETDEVYAKLKLVPVSNRELDYDDEGAILGGDVSDAQGKPTSFAKTLTQSDANNGGGFSVPRYCAETIFPRLDYSADPPVQTVTAKDVHGETWKFRHIYRGTPRRHLLTTGWSNFVNRKKLIAGDSIVFLRGENDDLCVGIRRAKRGFGSASSDSPSGWNSGAGNYVSPFARFPSFPRNNEDSLMQNCRGENSNSGGGCMKASGRVKSESVVEATTLAAMGEPFEVVYYPRAGTPEFCVRSSIVKTSLKINWSSGMRFKMPFETEDSSRISWFLGTVASVQMADPLCWPNSPWRLLEVAWDEPDLLQNVKWVSPWLVELVSNVPIVHLPNFSPPRKKPCLQQHPDFPRFHHPFPSFPTTTPLCFLPENTTPSGIQGARHAQLGIPFTDLHLYNNLEHSGFFSSATQSFDYHLRPPATSNGIKEAHSSMNKKRDERMEKPKFSLFGQPILTEQQIVHNNHCKTYTLFSEAAAVTGPGGCEKSASDEKTKNFSDGLGSTILQCSPPGNSFSPENYGYGTNEEELDTGHCRVFVDCENVGRTIDLSMVVSYEGLYKKLRGMLGMERWDNNASKVVYEDAAGAAKHVGDEAFSDFVRSAKKMTVLRGDSMI